jgi:PAS domain S-box-containing protein/putative nucleotidyltransferase with HDIG domain
MKSIGTQLILYRQSKSETFSEIRQLHGKSIVQIENLIKRSDEKFYKIFRSNPNPICFTAMNDGKIIEVNDSFLSITGYTIDEAIGKTTLGLNLWNKPSDRERYVELLNKDGHVSEMDVTIRTKSGDIRNILISGEIIELQNCKYIMTLIRDVTESRRAAELLKESERKHREFADQLPQIVCEFDQSGRLSFVNQNAFQAFGYSKEDLEAGIPVWQMIEPSYREIAKSNMAKVLRGEKLEGTEYVALRKDGTTFPILAYSKPIIQSGKATGLRNIAIDMSERKKIEKQLKSSEETLSKVFRNIPEAITVTSLDDGRLMEVNAGFSRISGYIREEVIGKSLMELNLYQNLSDRENLIEQTKTRGRAVDREVNFRIKSGDILNCLISTELIEIEGKDYALSVIRDITEQKRSEELLKASEEKYRLLMENSPNPILVITPDRSIRYVNPAFLELTGFLLSEINGCKQPYPFWPKDLQQQYIHDCMDSSITKVEGKFQKKNGETFFVMISTKPVIENGRVKFQVVNWIDITERKQAEENAKHSAEKLIQAMQDTLQAMVMVVEIRDPYTAGHQRRVAQVACAIAEEMGLSQDQITGLRLAGLIHDIGKIRVPAEILSNPGQLTEAETTIIKMHPGVGHDILKGLNLPWPISEIVYQHHERINGSGYPRGLVDKDIILEARVLAVADVVEAISSHRPYRPALGIDKALDEIFQNSGNLYDVNVADALMRLVNQKGFILEQGERP